MANSLDGGALIEADVAALQAQARAVLPQLNLQLRTESAADLDFSAALYALTRADEMRLLTDWSPAQKSAFCRAQFDAQHAHYRAHYPAAKFLIICEGDARIGRLYVNRTDSEVRLMEITLIEARRGCGIGGALSVALRNRAHAAGLPITLHVEPFNPARRLYERQGFRTVETRGIYLFMRCMPLPAQAPSALCCDGLCGDATAPDQLKTSS